MKLSKHGKETLGIAMLISAVSLSVTFVALAFKKRSVLAALLALAAAEGVAGAAILADADVPKLFSRRKAAREGDEVAQPYLGEELFVGDEADIAHRNVRRVLCDEQGGTCVRERKRVRKEILRDEDATEADFQ